MLVCTSDAHAVRQLDYLRYAVATARRGWVEPQGTLNTLPFEVLRDYLDRRRRRDHRLCAQMTTLSAG
jgi:DNA polymerase (family 10)